MPKSNGRPKNRQRKTPKVVVEARCPRCGGKPTKLGLCVRCLDDPINTALLQTQGIYLPTRTERLRRLCNA